MEGFRLELRKLESDEDVIYGDFKRGILDELRFKRQLNLIRDNRKYYEMGIERLSLEINNAAIVSVQKVFEPDFRWPNPKI